MRGLVYIVICDCPLVDLGNGVKWGNGDEHYHIDSVWTSEKKAEKRCKELNDNVEWREDYCYGLFGVEQQCLSK